MNIFLCSSQGTSDVVDTDQGKSFGGPIDGPPFTLRDGSLILVRQNVLPEETGKEGPLPVGDGSSLPSSSSTSPTLTMTARERLSSPPAVGCGAAAVRAKSLLFSRHAGRLGGGGASTSSLSSNVIDVPPPAVRSWSRSAAMPREKAMKIVSTASTPSAVGENACTADTGADSIALLPPPSLNGDVNSEGAQ